MPEATTVHYGLAPAQAPLLGNFRSLALSPDGSWMVYVGRLAADSGRQLWVKHWERLEATPVAGTSGANAPSVSPTGQWIAYWAAGSVRRIAAGGGPSTTIASEVPSTGLAWIDEETISYANMAGDLVAHPMSGEESRVLAEAPPNRYIASPTALPRSRGLLYMICTAGCVQVSEAWVFDAETGDSHRLLDFPVTRLWYTPNGYLVVANRDGQISGAPFDLRTLSTGAFVPVLDGVRMSGSGFPSFAISESGLMVRMVGAGDARPRPRSEAVWVDLQGTVTSLESSEFFNVGPNPGWALSPDGTQLVYQRGPANSLQYSNIFIMDLSNGVSRQLTYGNAVEDFRPRWSPDGSTIHFISGRGGAYHLYEKSADGSDTTRLLLSDSRDIGEAQMTQDGQFMVYRTGSGTGSRDLQLIDLRSGETNPLVDDAPSDEKAFALSRDENWIAYEKFDPALGALEIWVRPFPNIRANEWRISSAGLDPVWSHDGRRLYYLNLDRRMIAIDFTTDPAFRVVREDTLFQLGPEYLVGNDNYVGFDLHPDGQRFIMFRDEPLPAAPQAMIVTENWFAELEAKVGN
jgi:hypothetical protein